VIDEESEVRWRGRRERRKRGAAGTNAGKEIRRRKMDRKSGAQKRGQEIRKKKKQTCHRLSKHLSSL